MERMHGADATFIYTENQHSTFEICSLMMLDTSQRPDGQARFETVRERLEAKLHLAPMFRHVVRRVPFDAHHPVWVEDDQFDIDYHLRLVALPAPGAQDELHDLLGRLLSRPLDHSRPLWELYLIEGMAGGRSAVFFKAHHAAVDGVAGFEVLAQLVDLEADPPMSDPEPWKPAPRPSDLRLLVDAGIDHLKDPFKTAKAAVGLATDLANSWRPGHRPAHEVLGAAMAPPSPFNVNLTGQRQIRFMAIPLEEVKAVKGQAKVNDVLLALIGGGLRRYLVEEDALASESLLSLLPISIRTGTEESAGNMTTALSVELGTDEPDPHVRLQRIAKETAAAKERAKHAALPVIMDIAKFTGPPLASLLERVGVMTGMTARLRLAGNVAISNVANIDFPVFSAGSPVINMFPIGPLADGAGLNFTVLSYENTFYMSMLSDFAAVPDPDRLIAHVQDEWAAFKRS